MSGMTDGFDWEVVLGNLPPFYPGSPLDNAVKSVAARLRGDGERTVWGMPIVLDESLAPDEFRIVPQPVAGDAVRSLPSTLRAMAMNYMRGKGRHCFDHLDADVCNRAAEAIEAALSTQPAPSEAARAPLPVPTDILDARAQGRAEALAIILGLEAETGLDYYTNSIPPGPAGEWGTAWNEEKLRELLRADDSAWSLLQEAEGEYWHNLGLREEAERMHAARTTTSEQVAAPVPSAPEWPGDGWLEMDTAPRDGTLIRLLVDFTEHATEDSDRAPTIGHNSFDDTGEDLWQFAGWCWSHDHFTAGEGTPVGWLPMLVESEQVAASVAVTPEMLDRASYAYYAGDTFPVGATPWAEHRHRVRMHDALGAAIAAAPVAPEREG